MGTFVQRINNLLTLDSWNSTVVTKLTNPVVTAGAVTSSTLTFNWGAVAGANSYYGKVNNNNPVLLGNVTTYQVTGLTPGTTSTFQVYASDTTGAASNSDYSNSISGTTTASASYDTTLLIPSGGASQSAYGMRLSGPVGDKIEFNKITDDGSVPERELVQIANTTRSQLDFIGSYLTRPFRYTTAGGTIYSNNTFQNTLNGNNLS